MKKQLLTLLILIVGINTATAQNAATPNPSFENWTQNGNHWDPDNWNTLNPNTAIVGVLTCTRATGADVHTGTYAIKLTTKSVFGQTANGIATTGTLITTPPYGITGGLPFTQRPDSIVGWYKCTPVNNDHGFAEFSLFDANNDTAGYVRFNLPSTTVSSFTRFSAPIAYFNTNTPVISQWILSSSGPSNQVVNSMAIFDDVDLIFNPSAITSNASSGTYSILYSPQNTSLQITSANTQTYTIKIMNAAGAVCYTQKHSGNLQLSLHFLNSGLYFINISNNSGEIVTAKFAK